MSRVGAIIAGLVAVAALALAARLGGDGIDASVMGFDGLRGWLPPNHIAVVKADIHAAPRPADYALRLLPLYDINLRAAAKTDEARQASPRDMTESVFLRRLAAMPTLVVLPKWKRDFARTGTAADKALIGPAKVAPLLAEIGLDGAGIGLAPGGVLTEGRPEPAPPWASGIPGDLVVYRAQLFNRHRLPAQCHEIMGVPAGVLLVHCAAHAPFAAAWYLSDPDLLDNHGLSLGDNAAYAVAMLRGLRGADSRPILLDAVPGEVATSQQPAADKPQYTRNAGDLVRLLHWPLSALWAMGLLVAALAFWRGARRFGPPTREDEHSPELSKRAAIEAQARLLRLAGADREMARDFVQARLSELSQRLFGPHAAPGPERLWARLARRDAATGIAFRQVAEALAENGEMRPAELAARLRTFGELLVKVSHGSG